MDDFIRLKRQLELVQHARDELQTYLRGAFELRIEMPCTKCRTNSMRLIRFHTPRLSTRKLDANIGSITLVATSDLFYLIDGRCMNEACGYDLYAFFARVDPEMVLEPRLVIWPPEIWYSDPCPDCQKQSFRGFSRGGMWTGGICVSCGLLVGPNVITNAYQQAMRDIVEWIGELGIRERNLYLAMTDSDDASKDDADDDEEEITDIEILIKDFEEDNKRS